MPSIPPWPLTPGRCYIIAEAGVNHNGDALMARELVLAARHAGADAVKFQTFRAEALVLRDAAKARYQLRTTDPGESQFEMLRKLELPHETQAELAVLCKSEGIEFLSTPYNFEDVDFLDSLGVSAFKLASIHLVEPPFLQYVARKGKTMIVSTGMGTLDDVRQAVAAIRHAADVPIILLQCTTNYPSSPEDANLRALVTMRETLQLPVGYSDHTQSETCCVAAVALGAVMIEKHFTLDTTLPGPDHSSAAAPDEFARLVARIRETERALGSGRKEPSPAEAANAPAMRRGIVAKRRIAVGEIISAGALTLKRPGAGLAPRHWDDIVGLEAPRDIAPDEPLAFLLEQPVSGWSDFADLHTVADKTQWRLVPLTPADAGALSAILTAANPEYVAHFHPFDFDEATIRAQLERARRDRFWGFRAAAGELAGFYMLRGFDEGYERPAFGVFIAERFAGVGLACAALLLATKWCKQNEVKEIMLTVHPENITARRIYEKAGFLVSETGEQRLVMTKQLAK
ncbi:MAG: N-acetylneuraminate synthase [Chthoniobacteraceae bacterium]|jgi:N-acetylneuraminate synthase/N,N'-diacetyllegionaminate synthase